MYKYTCQICGQVIEDEEKDHVVSIAKRHYTDAHGLQQDTDVDPPSIETEEDAIRERIEEK